MGSNISSLGKVSYSSSNSFPISILGEAITCFGEGKFLKLKQVPSIILGEEIP